MHLSKATGIALALGLVTIAAGDARAAAPPPLPVILYNTATYAGHNCFSWLGPQQLTNSSAVYNPSTSVFDTMSVDCPIKHDMFYGVNPPGASGGPHGGIKEAWVRWVYNAGSNETMQCALKAVRASGLTGFTSFTLGTAFVFKTESWEVQTITGGDGNYDAYNYYLSCQLPPTYTNKSFLLSYGVIEQGLD